MTPLIENVMKHSLSITIAMLAVVMTACTQDDMHDGTNLITFEATTSNTVRSQASYSSSNPPAAFTVYAAKSVSSSTQKIIAIPSFMVSLIPFRWSERT